LNEAARRLDGLRADDVAVPHLIWLAAAGGDERAAAKLTQLAHHDDPAVRLQAVRGLAEFPAFGAPRELFIRALGDSDPQVRLAAVLAFFDRDGNLPRQLLGGPAVSSDT
jgi:HEAT repeat protein